ncbi:13404_t:CDS:10 [Ambispora gerdemannii]|uniref:Actin-like protein ARP6 n=1 Tax=Ambispora gerdemannii TaxID=144530 RepID=A0A9N8W1F3_9GLOM|nr:13404_t:CDS:10 [Ambispora gerdemannii]
MVETNVLILDNGASTIKVGYAGLPETLQLFPNCKLTRSKGDRKNFIADQLSFCEDFSGVQYRLPFEKGFLTNWEVEKAIWDRIFSAEVLKCDPLSTSLLVTEPCFNLPNIQKTYDEMIFEVYEFKSACRVIAPWFCIQNDTGSLYEGPLYEEQTDQPDCVLVVDSGYSFTHIVPFVMGRPIFPAIRRINIGGKLLTNHLKEIVSFRYWDMMDQTYVMNEVKETCCYVSQDFLGDLETCRKNMRDNPILREYVLPDFSRNKKGFIRFKKSRESNAINFAAASSSSSSTTNIILPEEQALFMNNERFSVPELLFNPSDIGMSQAGIPEVIVEAINATHPDLHGLFYSNIVLVGGNSMFAGYKERVEKDLRVLAPSMYDVRVGMPEDPISYAWHGGSKFARTSEYREKLVTRREYLEYGSNICLRRFGMGEEIAEIDD